MTRIKKTLVRRIIFQGQNGKLLDLVVYLQPDGLLTFRRHRGRKRYSTRLEAAWDRALNNGPLFDAPIAIGPIDKKLLPKKRKTKPKINAEMKP